MCAVEETLTDNANEEVVPENVEEENLMEKEKQEDLVINFFDLEKAEWDNIRRKNIS